MVFRVEADVIVCLTKQTASHNMPVLYVHSALPLILKRTSTVLSRVNFEVPTRHVFNIGPTTVTGLVSPFVCQVSISLGALLIYRIANSTPTIQNTTINVAHASRIPSEVFALFLGSAYPLLLYAIRIGRCRIAAIAKQRPDTRHVGITALYEVTIITIRSTATRIATCPSEIVFQINV